MHSINVPVSEIRENLTRLPILSGLPPDLFGNMAQRVIAFQTPDDVVLYTPEKITPWVNYLFFLIQGSGKQYGVGPDNIPWPNRHLTPGTVFGRHTTLLSMPPEISVKVTQGSILYGLGIEDLAYIVSRWPELFDRLVPLDRMRRLRAMPALAAFGDDHIRRLCDHVQVITLASEELLPLPPYPILWMVAEGQLAPIPNSRYPVATTGRSFVLEEKVSTTHTIRALRPTTVFGLPLRLWQFLMRYADPEGMSTRTLLTFPDVHAYLQHIPPFQNLPPAIHAELAGYMAWIFTPAGQTLHRAGDSDHALYVLVEGLATWRGPDREEKEREGTLYPGYAVGMDSLLHGHRATLSLTAARPSFWLRLSRDDLDRADREHRRLAPSPPLLSRLLSAGGECPDGAVSLWHCLNGTPPAPTPTKRRGSWLEEEERLLWLDRQHILFFVLRTLPWIILASFAITFLPTLPPGGGRQAVMGALVLMALWCAYIVVDYLNDFYALTDRRLVHRDRMWGIREHWQEIPLDQIQDVTIDQGFLGRLFGYGTLIITSAAPRGVIIMRRIPHPMDVQERILDARQKAAQTLRELRDQVTEEHMLRHMSPRLDATWPDLATGPEKRQDAEGETAVTPKDVMRHLAESSTQSHIPWPPMTFWQEGNTIYWRKHHLNLLWRVWRPALLLTFFLLLPLLFRRLALRHPGLPLIWGLLVVLVAGWLLWEYDDWRNDLYILTPDYLVDVEKRPLFAKENRRTAPLSRVQTVQMDMRNPLAHLFNYGDVIIRTAAEGGDLTFHFVPDPRTVVHTIEAHREAWYRRQQEQEYMRQARAMARAMDVYDRLTRGDHPTRPRNWRVNL